MRHLRPSMHARVGAPRALDVHRASEELLRRFPQLALHGSRVVLFLPAAILRAVVFDGQLPGFQLTQCSLVRSAAML